jgi:hypothetical protein
MGNGRIASYFLNVWMLYPLTALPPEKGPPFPLGYLSN